MKKPRFFNLEITLNCPNCGKEVPFISDPWLKFPSNLETVLADSIHEASTEHKCSIGELTINGKQYWLMKKP